ncbi:hypothetical protein G7085_18075 [Tessaracoccus sp. HDW20]|uniref:hypothetical protein n=1 Tax=Tessaracoccus coleopterorum TaxID=2714950 RepID=UPI0018D3CFE3|nr:hypothetical protein [Tessaracoccus coleopterorum]NHB85826.1 hypothetical protein [Tessaracoccus coleopterorum]
MTTTLVGLLVSGTGLAGLRMVEFSLLLIWIAEWPTRRFFFNIPAWVFGLVILALQVLPMLAFREWGALLGLILSLALVAIAARRVGLLSQYQWLPGGRRSGCGAPHGSPVSSPRAPSTVRRSGTAPMRSASTNCWTRSTPPGSIR